MFSQECVKNSVHRGVIYPAGRHPPKADTPHEQTPHPMGRHPPSETATAADGTHPTLMHSCLIFFFLTEECKQEDILFSLLRFLVTELVHVVHMNAKLLGIPRVYFCGNFVNHEITRRDIPSLFAVRNLFDMKQVKWFLSD